MELQDSSETGEKPQPTAEKVANLLFFSFKYSQGSFMSGFQNLIFEYLRELHPDWRFNKDQQAAVKQLLGEKVNKYFHMEEGKTLPDKKVTRYHTAHQYGYDYNQNPEKPIDDKLIAVNVDTVANSFFSRTTDDHEPWYPHEELVKILTSGAIQRDHTFLVRVGGRPRSGRQNPHAHERFQSQTIHYAIEGNSTSIPEYDQMFSEIGTHIQNGGISDKDTQNLSEIKEVVAQHQ